MLGIKSFKDGDRLVIVVEGLKDVPSEETLLKNFLSTIITGPDARVTTAPAAENIDPVAPESEDGLKEEIRAAEEREAQGKTVCFPDGPFKGKTVEEITKNGSLSVIAYLNTEVLDADRFQEYGELIVQNALSAVKEQLKKSREKFTVEDVIGYNEETRRSFLLCFDNLLSTGEKEDILKAGSLEQWERAAVSKNNKAMELVASRLKNMN